MARSQRTNVDFFLHKCSHGKRMKYLENEYGNDGYAVWFKLLEQLGKADHHFLHLENDMDVLLLADFCLPSLDPLKKQLYKTREDLLIIIISDMVKLGIFHRELWEKYKIIWCPEFIDSIKYVYEKREGTLPSLEAIRRIKNITITETTISDTEIKMNEAETPTREGKGREVNRREGKEATPPDVPSLEIVIKYFLENGYSRAAGIKFFETYNDTWHDTKGNPIKNWKMKAQKVWFRPEHLAEASKTKPKTQPW